MQKTGHRESAYARPTGNWRCGRVETCSAGPTPNGQCPLADRQCTPIRSVKSIKRRIAFWMLAASIAFFVLFLTNKTVLNYLSPGPLSMSHAEAASCKDCHSAASESISVWLHKAVRLNDSTDDKKCLDCHKLGTNAFAPHSTSTDSFSEIPVLPSTSPKSSSSWKVNFASKLYDGNTSEGDDVSCAVCHREHKGEFAPIKSFDPQQCHVCHEVKFDDLAVGHPVYTQYPHSVATRIHFDHVSHIKKHFLEDKHLDDAPGGCNDCHETDQSGEWMLARGFEASCSSCHLQEILGEDRASAKGVAVLSVPELDIETLAAAGYFVGEWPLWADGEVVPIMQLLLPKSSQNSAALQNKSLQFFDLSAASPEELQSVAELAWAIKQLFYDIQMGGTQVMNQRISSAFDEDLDQVTFNRLVAALPRDTLLNNQKEWFPLLMEEVSKFRRGEIEIFNPANIKNTRPVRSKKQITNTVPQIELQNNEIEDDENISFEEGDSILFEDDDNLLEEDDEPSIPQTDPRNASTSTLVNIEDNEDWARDGGWYRDGSNIRYSPVDHADPFFKTWLDLSSVQNDTATSQLFASLSKEESVGNCMKCHRTETKTIVGEATEAQVQIFDLAESNKIYWQSFKPEDVAVDFNRFSHLSHFGLMNDKGCVGCHQLNSKIPRKSGESIASFQHMERETCTACHQQGRAPDNCLTCHNYHVEPFMRSTTQISDSFKEESDSE